jgi:hypothetical protein
MEVDALKALTLHLPANFTMSDVDKRKSTRLV